MGVYQLLNYKNPTAGIDIVGSLPTTGNFEGRQVLLTTNDRVYISSYKNVHINGIFDLDIKSEFYWFKFFTTQSNIRDEKLKELGI